MYDSATQTGHRHMSKLLDMGGRESVGDDPRSGDPLDASGATPTPGEIGAAVDRAIQCDMPGANRLSYAHTSVAFRLHGGEERVTLLLDRRPPQVAGPGEPAEIEIELSPDQASRFVAGELEVPAEIVAGRLVSRGPVRKYLEVDVMLRHRLAFANARQTPGATPNGSIMRSPAAPDSELCAIETRGLWKSFGSVDVLESLNLTIPEGVISVVLGPSGTGKSVLLQHVIGLMSPDGGEVLVRGRALSRMSRSEVLALRREIGVMFQDGALFSNMNVYDNIAFPLRQHTDLVEEEIEDVVSDKLRGVGLAEAAQRMPNQLSGGMRKRAGLARALALDPGIILCDEPDSGLDPVRTSLLGALLVEQHSLYGGTMVVVTHNVPLAREVADHMSILWQGQVLESGLRDEVFASEDEFVRQFLAGGTEGPLGMGA